jgi:ubiquinone/menaquinone biosynthesis C-methylase UbiE
MNWKEFYVAEASKCELEPSMDKFCLHRCRAAASVWPRGPVESLLDVGCGDGFFCSWIQESKVLRRIAGTDISSTRVERAAERVPAGEFRVGQLPELPFRDQEFDVVTLIEVLEHLPEPIKALHELRRIGNRYVIITVPDR